MIVINFTILHHGNGFEAFGFVDVGFLDVVALFLCELIACPQVLGDAEVVLFANTATDGVVNVFGGLVIFVNFAQLVVKIVLKLGNEFATFPARSSSLCS